MSITDANNLRSTNYSISNFTDANRLGEDVTFNIEQLRSLGLGSGDNTSLINTVNNTVYSNKKESEGVRFDFKNYSSQYRSIRTFESSETYTAASGTETANTTAGQFLTGSQSIKGTNAGASGVGAIQFYSSVSSLAFFADGVTTSNEADRINFSFYINSTAHFTGSLAVAVWFYLNAGSKYNFRARYYIPVASLVNGWNHYSIPKNSFTYENFTSSDWANVLGFYVYCSTSSTSAEVSFDNLYMVSNVNSLYDSVAYSGTSNSDISTGSTLTVTDGRRLNNLLLTSPYNVYLSSLSSATNGYGKSLLITDFTNSVLTVLGTLPTVANNVTWEIQNPLLDVKEGNFIYTLEETASVFKIATVTDTTPADKIALLNTFKPSDPNGVFYLKAHFQFRTNSNKQGFCLYYIDSDNYLLAYIDNQGASSVVCLDEYIDGNLTNIYTSGTFTITANDDIIFLVRVSGDKISLYKSSVNTPNLALVKHINYYDSTFIDYKDQVGIYSDLEIRVLALEAREDKDIPENRLYSVNSGTFATASTLTITDTSIHKSSQITYQLRSAPVGNIYISAISEGSITFTSSSASETAQIQIHIYN